MLPRIPPANFKAQQNLVSGQGESLNFSAPKIFRIHVKLRQNLCQENCREKICGFRKYPKFSPNFRNLAFHSSQIIISNILIHKCVIASPNLCQIVVPNGSLGSFCAKLLRQINICDQSAQKMCAKFCSSRCSAPKIFRKYTLKFTLGFRHTCGRADRILRPRGQGGVKFIVRISENCNLCHANLNTTIKGL